MTGEVLKERLGAIADEAARSEGAEFVHLEIAGTKRNSTVRVFIDKEGGVTLDDCAKVSNRIENVMDAEDFIPTHYLLEVSSPGLDRELYGIDDFIKFSGRLAKIKTNTSISEKRMFLGHINGVENGIVIFDDSAVGIVRIPYSTIMKANLRIDLEAELRRR